MKILIPILGFGRHGGQRVLSRLADNWLDQGHEATFLVPEPSTPPYFPTKAAILRANRKGVIASGKTIGVAGRAFTGADNLLSLYAGLNDVGSHFDIILANNSLTAWPVRLARCGTAKKYYYIQAFEPEYYKPHIHPAKHLLSSFSYRLGLEQISNSTTYPIKTAPSRIKFVPPGVDSAIFYSRRDRRSLAKSDVIVLGTVGRTEPHKGTRFVLEAFEKLHLTDSRFRLRIAFGNLPSGWSHPAAEVANIHNDTELADFYRSLDILLVGCYGQFGAPHYPVIEGMSCGTPVVHTGYFPGTAANSWIVTPKDSSALVAGVNEVVTGTEADEKIASALQFVSNNLTWPALAASMLTHFRT